MSAIVYQDGVDEERQRCLMIVNAARNGDIDNDCRTIAHFIRGDYEFEYNEKDGVYTYKENNI